MLLRAFGKEKANDILGMKEPEAHAGKIEDAVAVGH